MAGGLKFLWEFSVGAYDYQNPGNNVKSVTSTAAGDHDKTYLTSTPLRETWRSADLATQYIVIEANDTTNPIDVFAILNHNFSSDAVVTLEANSFNNFAAPPYTRVIAWNEKNLVNVETLSVAYSFFRIKILDPGNACGYLEIGRIVAGTALTMANDEDVTDEITISPQDLAYQMPTEGFFRASNERVKVDQVSIRFDRLRTDTSFNDNYLALKEMFNEVGTTLPFLTVIDPDETYFYNVWGQFQSMPSRSYTINRYVSTTCSIEEVL